MTSTLCPDAFPADGWDAILNDGTPRPALTSLLDKLDAKLKQWKPETAADVRHRVAEMIVLADQDALDLIRSRAIARPSVMIGPRQ